MLLTPTELERLTIYVAAELARKHKAKGLQLNHPEAIAFIVDEILEGAREGRSVADLISLGSTLLSTDDVMPGVAALMPMIQVEATFPDGTKLVTVHDPIRPGKRKTEPKESGQPGRDHRRRRRHRAQCRPARRPRSRCSTPATGRSRSAATIISSRPTRRSSSTAAPRFGMHLDIPAGTAVRFEPGEAKDVTLTEFGGSGELFGLNGLTDGNGRSDGRTNGSRRWNGPGTRGFQGSMTRMATHEPRRDYAAACTARPRATPSASATPRSSPRSSTTTPCRARNACTAAARRCATGWA